MINQDDINFFTGNVLWFPIDKLMLNLNQFYDLVFPEHDYDIVKVYGRGAFGLVLHVKHKITNKNYALKLLHYMGENTDREFKIQPIFANYNMAPKLYQYEVVIKNEYLVGKITYNNIVFVKALMDPITMTVNDYINRKGDIKKLYQPFECLIIKKYILNYSNSLLHGDMHIANICILKDGKTLGFIDFGWTFDKPSVLQLLDCIPLITSLLNSGVGLPLANFLIKLYDKMFNIKLDMKKFKILQSGGYAYQDKDIFLHSYNFIQLKMGFPENIKGHITIEDIKRVFPNIDPPKVM